MDTEFNSILMGENIILSSNWTSIPITLEQHDTDIRHEALGNEQNPSTITMLRTNRNETVIFFQKDSIVAVNKIQIRYNIHNVIKQSN